MRPRSTRAAICATPPASSSPRCRRATPTTTGIKALKIRHNNVLGYFVEVTAQHGDKLMAPPLNATFIHRQTLAGQVRFTTAELGEIEAKIANAGDRALGLELEIFERLCAMALAAERRSARRRACVRAARRRDRAGEARRRRQLRAARGRRLRSASPSRAAGIRWSNRR